MSCAGTTRVAAAITWASSGLPPTSCSTFGSCDLRRVPLPAAMMATATRGAAVAEVLDEAIAFDFIIYLSQYIAQQAASRRYEPDSYKAVSYEPMLLVRAHRGCVRILLVPFGRAQGRLSGALLSHSFNRDERNLVVTHTLIAPGLRPQRESDR